MSQRDDEMMRILGKLEARADSTHEYVVAVSEKVARHVEDKELHGKSGGVHLELPHAFGAGGVLMSMGALVQWITGIFHSKPPHQ